MILMENLQNVSSLNDSPMNDSLPSVSLLNVSLLNVFSQNVSYTKCFLPQNVSCYKTFPVQKRFLLLNVSCHKTFPATKRFLPQNVFCYKTFPYKMYLNISMEIGSHSSIPRAIPKPRENYATPPSIQTRIMAPLPQYRRKLFYNFVLYPNVT